VGEEVTIDYGVGSKDNAKLLITYGFTDLGNPAVSNWEFTPMVSSQVSSGGGGSSGGNSRGRNGGGGGGWVHRLSRDKLLVVVVVVAKRRNDGW